MKIVNLEGARFGSLTVKEYAFSRNGKRYWNCVCDCGNTAQVSSSDLRTGNTKTCGCGKYAYSVENLKGAKKPAIPMVGKRFGRLLVTGNAGRNERGNLLYSCVCDCGKSVIALGSLLRNGGTKSCGCLATEKRKEIGKASKGRASSKVPDLAGKIFGLLTVIQRDGSNAHGQALWLCRCECGKETHVTTTKLNSGATKSCGCLGLKHATEAKIKHGQSGTPLYRVFKTMHNRCERKSTKEFRWYGAKGVRLCDDWKEFQPFYDWAMSNGYRHGLTIDRINPDGDYEPSNCRWITRQENSKRVDHTKKQ